MRQAFHNVSIIGQPLIGVSLGSDHCSEHEWGIKRIKEAMGVNTDAVPGIARRMMGEPLVDMHILEFKATKTLPAETRIGFGIKPCDMDIFENRKSTYCHHYKGKLSAAWNEASFMVRAFSDEDRAALREIKAAFDARDLAIGLGGSGPFSNSPLSLVIASRFPDEDADALRAADEDHAALLTAAKATGIQDRLAAAGKRYFALRPRWIDTFKSLGKDGDVPADRSAHPVIFWLNPCEQNQYHYGWYTVEELDQWARNEGVIIKANRLAKA